MLNNQMVSFKGYPSLDDWLVVEPPLWKNMKVDGKDDNTYIMDNKTI